MKKPTKKPEHRPIVIDNDHWIDDEERQQIMAIAKQVIEINARLNKETDALVAKYRDIVGFKELNVGTYDLDFTWDDSPQEWVDEAERQRKVWFAEEIGFVPK